MNFKLVGSSVAALALLATTWTAQAADIPRPVPVYKGVRPAPVIAYYNWTGFYAGINVGYGWGTSSWDVPAVSTDPNGMLVGGTIGYNFQTGSFVWGLEGDIAWSDVKGSVNCGLGLTCETANKWLGTARGRLGYAFDRFLPYITGGAAFGDVRASVNGQSASSTQTGWTFGGGLEYAFLGNWTAKVEYLYVDLGSFNPNFTVPATRSVDFKENIIRGGLNYKFSGPIFSRW